MAITMLPQIEEISLTPRKEKPRKCDTFICVCGIVRQALVLSSLLLEITSL